MSLSFPAGGSIYYPHDLEGLVTGRKPISLEEDRFCVGPDVNPIYWYGKRSQLDVDRGPCTQILSLKHTLILKPTLFRRHKRRSNARSSSSQGTCLPQAVWPAALAKMPDEEERVSLPGTVALRPRYEPTSLSPNGTLARPQHRSWAFLHAPPRPPAGQCHRRAAACRLPIWILANRSLD